MKTTDKQMKTIEYIGILWFFVYINTYLKK